MSDPSLAVALLSALALSPVPFSSPATTPSVAVPRALVAPASPEVSSGQRIVLRPVEWKAGTKVRQVKP